MPLPSCRIESDGPGRLRVEGDLDELGVPALRSALETHGGVPALVVDLSDASYLCSQAVSVLVGAIRGSEAMGRSLTLEALDGSIAHRVLQVLAIPHEAI
ncbi:MULTISPECIES: STAS domain-containing protein [Nocardioides]|uniref:Anti-anti-sigma regulatory factor (Antagonist of anti-sigma factor) n=1 Tax=Nocardioides lianchengensis TaxID=1045774 RepID=A0A1G6TNY8_9ACTN|nr:STAS domain-containing protein [Nocardioides lianchengensis]NYG11691.1 anti-anti-sigma regulatory factor [Nocardioides lianchengensis]SDD30823.1 Anti-anti-sigma regulatory factor (antagonist of anti-sigma factor) [Nocardioides lianchengensis]